MIIRYDTTLEFRFRALSPIVRSNDAHYLSTLLLQRNREPKGRVSVLEEIGSDLVFSCMHNAEIQLIDAPYFERVVRALIHECDDLEQLVVDM